jgi:hypothetical protein
MSREPAEQSEMFPNKDELAWRIVEKIRSSDVLTSEELVVFEDRMRASVRFRDTDRKRLIAAWRAEYRTAISEDCPNLTDEDIKKLQNVFGRVGNLAKVCALIHAFFPYRASFFRTQTSPPQLSPWGLEKHLIRLTAWAAERRPGRDGTVRRLTDDEEQARRAPPSKEEVRAFVAGLAGEKRLPEPPRARTALAKAEAVNERRRELQAQAATLQQETGP